MKKVLVNKPIHDDAIAILSNEVEVLTPYKLPAEEILNLLTQVNAIILCAGFKIDASTLEKVSGLEVIGRHGAGLEIVDIDAVTKAGIPVVYTPQGPTESTAEHAFLLMMAAARKLSMLDRATRNGNFNVRDHVVGTELFEKKAGIIGFGRIGKRFAEMCRDALHMEIYAYDPALSEKDIKDWGAIYCRDAIEMANQVDIISIHCPANKSTHRLVNAEVLDALGPKGFLVSASRGSIVDETVLVRALKENRIAGAGIDVYDPEPPASDNPLFQMDNVVLTPHLASFTDEGRRRMGVTVAEDVLRVLKGDKPRFLANPEVFQKL